MQYSSQLHVVSRYIKHKCGDLQQPVQTQLSTDERSINSSDDPTNIINGNGIVDPIDIFQVSKISRFILGLF